MMTPAGAEHGAITVELTLRLGGHVREHRLGKVYAAETGFMISTDPDTVRAADVAFVRADRVPGTPVRGFFAGAPDLAVQVISPSDRRNDVRAKVTAWIAAGCQAVWLVDAATCAITVYQADGQVEGHQPGDVLYGGGVVPGFEMMVGELFEDGIGP